MKKKQIIMFRILEIIISFIVIFFIIFWNVNRLKGSVFVTINGKEYWVERLECKYEDGNDEKILYEKDALGTTFQNHGAHYGMYEYSFFINNEEISIEPQICVFKTSWWEIYDVDIDMNIYEDNEIWNADISVDIDNRHYQETFYDIENNKIEFRVE